MRKFLCPLALCVAVLLLSPLADACHSCAGWGVSWGKRLDVCASPSEAELDALVACDRSNCSTECASYLASYDACDASGDPACEIDASGTDCWNCQAGIGPWSGIGCSSELTACSYDRTGCTPCADWLFASGDIDNLCYPEAIDASINLSLCACSGACATKCSTACVEGGGFHYFVPDAAGFKCGTCLAGAACGAQFNACSAM